MSEFVFKLPDLGEGTVESEIGEWFIKVGDNVSEEDVVGTMMTDKAAIEVSSPISGTVLRLGGEPVVRGNDVRHCLALALGKCDHDWVVRHTGGERWTRTCVKCGVVETTKKFKTVPVF